jgi:FKBP-type peptidyl-prolyl cis-trans isomerase (trigger factor)
MQFQNVKVSRDEKAWEVEVRAEIPAEGISEYREKTLKEMQREAKLDGFRPGKAPIERIVEIYGEQTIRKHAVEHAIQEELPELLAAEKALIIESPRVSIEAAEEGKPVRFSARAALAPLVELPDYKTIAKKKNGEKEEVSVTDDEHKEAMTHFKREKARIEKTEKGSEPQKAVEEARAMDVKDLPELDDAFAKSLGLENLKKFSEAVRSNMKTEKELQAREKRRAALFDELVAGSTIKYPAALREYELDDMEGRMKHDLERMGTTFDAYLTNVKKTREQVRVEWQAMADKRAKVRLVLAEIARKENLEPDKERLEKEIAHAKENVPSADPAALRAHIAHALRNEATIEFLESQN